MESVVLKASKKAFGLIVLTLFIFSSFLLINQNAEAQPDLFENGSFETGDFTDWTVVQEPGSGGNWFVYSGNLPLLTNQAILLPPDGTFAATTDQTDPSSQVLFQDIEVPAQGTTECSVIVYYNNLAGEFINGPNLNTQGPGSNQQARIDIMDPNATDFDIGAGVLENLFQTNPGDPLVLGYTTIKFDLTDFAGTTVRFRAAEVDNLGNFLFSIDNVTCAGEITAQVPTLSEWGLIAMASILGIVGFMVMRRRQVAA
ncbi:MAG: IPTL-CTERM sorting domain-containing protein [Thermodesulfobacteriota bacterium]